MTETIDLIGRLERDDRRRRRRRSSPTACCRRCSTAARPRSSTASTRSRTLLVEAAGPGVRQVLAAAHVTEARRRTGNRHLERLRAGIPAGAARALRARAVHQGHRPPRRRPRGQGAGRRTGRADVSRRRMVSVRTSVARRPCPDQDGRPLMARRMPVGLDALLASKEMVLVLGSGGVGKTTVAAALGLAAAVDQGGQVLVLTVDPAQRLADALGVGALGNVATPGARRRVRGRRRRRRAASCGRRCSTPRPGGTTSSAATRPTPRCATRCSATRCTRTSPAASCTATTTWRWSSCTTSTPRASTTSSSSTRRRRATPCRCSTRRRGCASSSAAGCCAGSPCRTGRGCSRWPPSPSTRWPIGSSGSGFLRDIADFFVLFQAMEKGFVARAREVEALLGDARTTFLVVSTLETAPAHEAAYLARELLRARLRPRRHRRQPGAADRRSPGAARRRAPSASARRPPTATRSSPSRRRRPRRRRRGRRRARSSRDVLAEVAARFHDVALVATREAERRAELAALAPQVHRRAVARLRRQRPRRRCMALVDHLRG